MELESWKENPVYPGTHWLLYGASNGGPLVAEVHGDVKTSGRYRWLVDRRVVKAYGPGFESGYEDTLEQAQQAAEEFIRQAEARWELNKPRVQMKMFS